MRLHTFFLMQLKRLWKNKLFLVLLLLFPVCLYLLSHSFQKEEDSRILVGVCLDTEDELAETLYEKLLDLEDSLFSFSSFASEDELIKAVQSNQLECGYLLRKDLGKELDKNRLKNLITVYVSENTTCKGIINELVYANLFEEYSLSLLQDCLEEAAHLPFTEKDAALFSLPPVTEEAIEKSYRSQLENGSTFRFDVEFISKQKTEPLSGTTAATVPLLRGFTAVFLLLCGFLAMLASYNDEKNGVFARLGRGRRFLFSRITMLAYLLPSGLICLLGLALCGSLSHLGTEFIALIGYLFALLLFYTILGTLIHNHTVLCAAFPMVVLCTLIFTPVLVDLSAFFPWIKVVRYVLPSYYYLLFF
ncbi:MAG: ABC transporter permease [Lachnospiraceae bacterium]|nr:ABC transporter permease [Lachnospiraceae bacterium]